MTAPSSLHPSVAVKLLAVGAMAVPLLVVDSPPGGAETQLAASDRRSNPRLRRSRADEGSQRDHDRGACYADTRNYVYCAPKQEVYDLGVIPNGVTSPGYS